MKRLFTLLIAVFVFASCETTESGQNRVDLMQHADSLTNDAQKALMGNLMKAIEEQGHEYALEFCNVNAIPITDSLSQAMKVTIQRLSENNRNPINVLATANDKAIFEYFKEHDSIADTLLTENGHDVYYKRINLAMAACANCHGKEIEPDLLAKINSLYPEDKATGYALNDFRGMWKVTYDGE